MAAGTLPFMLKTMRDNAEASYLANASTQLQLMGNYVETFISSAERDVALLAQEPYIAEAVGLFPNFSQNKEADVYLRADLSVDAFKTVQPLVRLDEGSLIMWKPTLAIPTAATPPRQTMPRFSPGTIPASARGTPNAPPLPKR